MESAIPSTLLGTAPMEFNAPRPQVAGLTTKKNESQNLRFDPAPKKRLNKNPAATACGAGRCGTGRNAQHKDARRASLRDEINPVIKSAYGEFKMTGLTTNPAIKFACGKFKMAGLTMGNKVRKCFLTNHLTFPELLFII
jgi:hypothetical protein